MALLGACTPPAQTVVLLDGAPPAGAVDVEVTTCTQDGLVGSTSVSAAPRLQLPHRVPVDPIGGDTSRVFRLVATYLGETGPLSSVTVVAGFPSEGRAEIRRVFDRSCDSVACGALETCVDGACVDAVESGVLIEPSIRRALATCALGVPHDSGVEPVDAGFDAGDIDAGAGCDPSMLPGTCPPTDLADCLPAPCEVLLGQGQPTRGMNEGNVPPELQRVTLNDNPADAVVRGFYIHLFSRGRAGSSIRAVVYANHPTSGLPDARVMISEDVNVVTPDVDDRWFFLPVAGDGTLEAGAYWIGFAGTDVPDGGGRMRYSGRTIVETRTRLGNTRFALGSPDPWEDWAMATTTGIDYEVAAVGQR